MRTVCLIFLITLAAVRVCEGEITHPNDPVADPAAVVTGGQVRFTVLTPQMVRLEWSEDARFVDQASLLFINRRLPVPRFTVQRENGWISVRTEQLLVRYREGSGQFTKENLSAEFQVGGSLVRWNPGVENRGNLLGTIRTLDGVKGATELPPGLLSRDGWVVIDDTERPLLDGTDWPWVMARPEGNRQDMYLFAYGRDYKRQLYDFTRVAGRIPVPPRFAFGLWWSRYWAYTDQEFKELVKEFETRNVPLDVLVIDMDWHLTFDLRWSKNIKDQAGQRLGWTGYTWDRTYFPDPEGFLSWCANRGLKTPMNLHPASGVQPHEERYPEMAKAMGIDPESKKYVPFDIVDKKFATNYMNIMIRPLERQGVDFWWLDWQQWSSTTIAGVTPTWWLNYVFFTDMERRGRERPLLFHRWGGLGNHRYQIGFSGDAISVWESLAFQPYFTATASNVGFGYWSHDIGGHMPGIVSGELYARWIQFGTFSPIVRTHTTKNPDAERRIWAYPDKEFTVMRDAILLRYALLPYVYTASREAYDTGVSICRPMYYEHPEATEAYEFTDQYFFGDDIIVAPVATPVDSQSQLATKRVWLPAGEWHEWFTGSRIHGPVSVTRSYPLDEIPVFVRSGSIIPMQPEMRYVGEKPVDPLILTIFEGDSGHARLYEDQGNSLGYQRGECAWTDVRQMRKGKNQLVVEIGGSEGRYPGMPAERAYEIRLVGYWPPTSVECNGNNLDGPVAEGSTGWRYDGDAMTTVITLPRVPVADRVTVDVHIAPGPAGLTTHGVRGAVHRLRRVMDLVNSQWSKEWSPEILVAATQTGNRMSLDPGTASREVAQLRTGIGNVEQLLPSLNISDAVRARVALQLSGINALLK